jgi:hypothetical protein
MRVQWAILPNIPFSLAEVAMYTVKEAKLIRITERNDVRCADVEVQVEGMNDVMLAEFRSSKDHTLDMTHVYRKEVSRELDWYDNNLHQAYEDVTTVLFEENGQETDGVERESFKQQILGYGNLRQEVLSQLQGR